MSTTMQPEQDAAVGRFPRERGLLASMAYVAERRPDPARRPPSAS